MVVWLGAAHEWGSGNAIDASVLGARTHLLVLTLNYRIGLLGESTLPACWITTHSIHRGCSERSQNLRRRYFGSRSVSCFSMSRL